MPEEGLTGSKCCDSNDDVMCAQNLRVLPIPSHNIQGLTVHCISPVYTWPLTQILIWIKLIWVFVNMLTYIAIQT